MVMTLMIKIEQSRVVCLQPRLYGDYAESIAFSISLASALTSFFISFLARLVASSTARPIVASPTTINAASLSSSISPTSLRSELDIPPRRWPISAPAPAPISPLTRIEGGKIRPSAAPTAKPAQPPCCVGFSILSTISTLPSSFFWDESVAEDDVPGVLCQKPETLLAPSERLLSPLAFDHPPELGTDAAHHLQQGPIGLGHLGGEELQDGGDIHPHQHREGERSL